jgi:hypothetical protein
VGDAVFDGFSTRKVGAADARPGDGGVSDEGAVVGATLVDGAGTTAVDPANDAEPPTLDAHPDSAAAASIDPATRQRRMSSGLSIVPGQKV